MSRTSWLLHALSRSKVNSTNWVTIYVPICNICGFPLIQSSSPFPPHRQMSPSMCYLQPQTPCHYPLAVAHHRSRQTPLPKPGTLVEVLLSWLHITLFCPVGRSSKGAVMISYSSFECVAFIPQSLSNSSLKNPLLPLLILLPFLKIFKARKGKVVPRLRDHNLERLLPPLLSNLSRTRAAAQWTCPHSMLMLRGRITRNPGKNRRGTTRVQTGKIFPRRIRRGELGTGGRSSHELWSSRGRRL